MAKGKGSGAGGHSPATKTAAGAATAKAVKETVKKIDVQLTGEIKEIEAIQRAIAKKEQGSGAAPGEQGEGFSKRKEEELAQKTKAELDRALARAEAKAQQLLHDKARELAKLKSDEAKIAEIRSEKGVEAFAGKFKIFDGDYSWNAGSGPGDPNGANAWGIPKYKPWAQNLRPAEFAAVKSYSGSGYGDVNKLLRFGPEAVAAGYWSPGSKEKAVKKAETTAKRIDAALKKAPVTTEDIQTVRYFSLTPLYQHYAKHGTLNGALVQDKGFVSTSLNKDWQWHGGFKAKVLIPKGSQGAYINKIISGHSSEYEFVLPKGTRFKIIKTKPISGKQTEITMVAYTPNHPKYNKIKPGFGE